MPEGLTKITCGCGDHFVAVEEQPDELTVLCPECGNYYGYEE